MPPYPAAPPVPARGDALWRLLLLSATVAATAGALVVAQRLGYPFELEWMEGAMADHAARVAAGQPLYCAPGPEHVPFLYAPLLFWLGGGLAWLGLDELLALRLVGTGASLAVALLIGHWVRRETGRVVPGLVATGLYLAGYAWFWWWYDLARNDSLFVLGCLGAAYALRHGGRRGVWLAALAAVLACLAKQSALMWLPAIGTGALCADWRRALRFGAAAVVGIGAAYGLLHLQSSGWSTFYLFEMPRHHGIEADKKLGFWTDDLPPMLPLLALGGYGFVARWRGGDPRGALFLAAVGSGGLVASWLSRLHTGGFDNVLAYGFAAACVLGPAAIAHATSAAAQRGVAALLLAQFALLGWQWWAKSPQRTALPSAAHRAAHEELAAWVAQQPGPVLIPGHGRISRRAGKGAGAHGQAIFDLLQVLPRDPEGRLDLAALVDPAKLAALPPRAQQALQAFRDGMLQAMLSQRYAAIVLDEQIGAQFELLFHFGLAGPDGQVGTGDDLYRRRSGSLLRDGAALNPLMGFPVHSPYALEAVRR